MHVWLSFTSPSAFFLSPCILFMDHWTVMFCKKCGSLGSTTMSNNSFNHWKLRLNQSFLVWRFHLGCAYFLPSIHLSLPFARETDMDGALVGGAFMSASLQFLFHRSASHEVLNLFTGHKLNHALKKLKRKLLSVHAVLNDAKLKQITNPTIKEKYYIKCFPSWYAIVIKFFIRLVKQIGVSL